VNFQARNERDHPHEDTMGHAKLNQPEPHVVKSLEELDQQDEDSLGWPRPPVVNRKPREFEPHVGDMVNLPPHYARYKIEPMRYAVENGFNSFQFNISKYLARAEFKHDDKGQEDLRKVIRCGIMYALFLAGDPDWWKSYTPEFMAALDKELTPHADRT
jgi:hypothetical protein